jgi:GEVED domain/Secretion system C-terminal sorting domain
MKNNYRNLFKMNLSKLAITFVMMLGFNSVKAQYCVTSLGGANCSASDQITGVEITGTTLVNLNNTCTSTPGNTLTVFPPSGSTTADLIQGVTYSLAVTSSANNIMSVWFDYDNDSIYTAAEWTQICTTSTAGGTTTITFTVPFTSTLGLTGMRIRSRAVNNQNGAGDACLNFGSGEAEDYTINIIPNTPCSGTPTAGTSNAPASICPSVNFTVSLSGSTLASGLTYQWQSSPDNITWNNVAGANNISFSANQSVNTYYRCIVSCGALSDTSTVSYVTTNTFISCYCTSTATTAFDEDIGNVSFGALNNGSATPATNNATANALYTDFTALPPAVFLQGINYPISISQINVGTFEAQCRIAVFIDYDHNGLYDTTSEKVYTGVTNITPGTNTISGNVTIPLSSTAGLTGMRVVLVEGLFNILNSCGTYFYGETEDYIVNLQAATPCVAPPTAGTTISSVTSVCPNVNFNLNLTGTSIASGLSFQWQSSPNGTTWTNIAGATSINLTTSLTSNTFYHCIVTCNAVPDTSTDLLVSVNSFTTCYCISAATNTADDDIGNVTFGALNNGIGTPALSNSTSTNVYTNFTSLPPSVYLQGLVYPISVTQINSSSFFYSCYLTVYIDYNQDGIFDINNELIFDGETDASLGGNTLSGNVTIPLTSTPGITGMRVILRETGFVTQPSCGTYTYGETEDYLVDILAAPSCAAPPTAGLAFANDSTVCPNINYNLNLQGSSIAAGLSYQWQSSANGTTWANVSAATSINFTTAQTSDTYYRCIISCAGVPDTSTVVFIATNAFTTCYCTSAATDPADSDIGNVSLSSLNNGNASPATNNTAATNTYTNFTAVAPPVILQGLNYPISVTQISQTSIIASNLKVYIDYNQDGIYDQATEEVLSAQSSASTGGNVMSGNFVVPLTASIGNTGMRVVLVEGTFTTVTPCGTYFNGETEDYIVNIQAPQACTTPPVAGTAVVSPATVCPNLPFDLNLTGSANASGLSYQWQESTNGTTWNNIAGATSILYSYAQTVNTYYRCVVTCASVSSNSTPVLVTTNSFYNCYCSSGATSTVDDDIGNVTFGLLSNGVATPSTQNSTSVNTYSNFTSLPPFSYIQTLTYPISMTQINSGNFYACSGAIYIDYDHDGNFDPSTESVLTGSTAAGSLTIGGTVTIPLTALTGITGMRVVLKEGTNPAAQPCGTYTWGETEDYLVNILAPNSCSIPFNAGFSKANSSLVCASDVFTLSIDSLPPDTGFSFQWQYSYDSLNWNNIAGATVQVYNGSQSFDSWYRCNVGCNGGSFTATVPVKILSKSVTQCDYCNTGISGNCSTNYYIDSLAIGGTTFNNAATGCAANAGFAYSKYPATGNTTASLARGNYYDMYVKTAGSCNISVWLDFDQSGTFDPNEWIQVSQATDSAISSTVPMVLPSATSGLLKLGTTGMRVRSRKAGNLNLGANSCSAYGSGETEDYYVTIVDAISTGKELSNDKNVKIFPNPTTGMVSIEYRSNDSKSLTVRLMNPSGQLIYEENNAKFKGVYSHKLDLGEFSKGIYFVQFVTDSQIVTKKIVLN